MTSLIQLLPGVHLVQPKIFTDNRGDFVKTYHIGAFLDLGIDFKPVEEFLSTSHKGVLRGMHFQLPPHDHGKLVYCIRGRVLDVLLDLRKNSPAYGKHVSVELSCENHHELYIPSGIAHGFLSLEDDSVMIYKTSTVHASTHDSGIHWDSFGFDWPKMAGLIVSQRDQQLSPFESFVTPF